VLPVLRSRRAFVSLRLLGRVSVETERSVAPGGRVGSPLVDVQVVPIPMVYVAVDRHWIWHSEYLSHTSARASREDSTVDSTVVSSPSAPPPHEKVVQRHYFLRWTGAVGGLGPGGRPGRPISSMPRRESNPYARAGGRFRIRRKLYAE